MTEVCNELATLESGYETKTVAITEMKLRNFVARLAVASATWMVTVRAYSIVHNNARYR